MLKCRPLWCSCLRLWLLLCAIPVLHRPIAVATVTVLLRGLRLLLLLRLCRGRRRRQTLLLRRRLCSALLLPFEPSLVLRLLRLECGAILIGRRLCLITVPEG